jgi:hypothetical protein
VLILSIIFLICYQSQFGSISGNISDAESGTPLSDAVIRVTKTDFRTKSDKNGRFVLEKVPPGKYKIRILYMEYVPMLLDVDVAPDSMRRLDVVMHKPGFRPNRPKGFTPDSSIEFKMRYLDPDSSKKKVRKRVSGG